MTLLWTVVKYVGLVWVALRLLGHVIGISVAIAAGDEDQVVSIATIAAQDGLIVTILLTVALPFVLPGVVRTNRLRRMTSNSEILLAVANPDLRGLLMRSGTELSLHRGSFRPRMIYSATLSVDTDGVRVWTGLGKPVGLIPAFSIASAGLSTQALGVFQVPALRISLIDGSFASFVLASQRFPWFTSLGAKAVERVSQEIMAALGGRPSLASGPR